MENESIINPLSGGWVARFTASGRRLEEAIKNYRQLGFEVKTISVKNLKGWDCSVCFEDENDQTEMIFTRKTIATGDDELYD